MNTKDCPVYKSIYMKFLEKTKLIYGEGNKKCFPVGTERNGKYEMVGKGRRKLLW